jgi:two-component system nitrate/nitrite response regulator NarL
VSLIRILIADDHPSFREGLTRLLEAEPGLKVVGEASNGADVVKRVRELQPDLLLLDLKMPQKSGLEALSDLKEVYRGKTILFTAEIETRQIAEALLLGAGGVVLKDAATRVLMNAIRTVMAEGHWVGTQPVADLPTYLRSQAKEVKVEERRKTFGLTAREFEIISGVAAGLSNKEIAQHFKISEDTVKHHLSNIFDKTGVSSRVELVIFAINHHLPLIDID